ncbi:hypothetical protein JCM14076_24750 [Methylosoma difficile]
MPFRSQATCGECIPVLDGVGIIRALVGIGADSKIVVFCKAGQKRVANSNIK